MAPDLHRIVLPRPGRAHGLPPQLPIPGPPEAIFQQSFGALLPPASYLNTADGRAAYYEILPTSHENDAHNIDQVLFIHGVQTPALGMLPLARTLHASFPQAHLVLIDLWGHGLSDTPVVPHEASLFHRLIDALFDQLGWNAAHFVGFSFGGALTAGYVASRSSRVKTFTLVAPAGLMHFSDFTSEEQNHLRGGDEEAARKWVLEWLEGGELFVPENWRERVGRGEIVAEALRDWQQREHPGHVASVVAVCRDGGIMDRDADFVSALSTGIPSLVVLGELDDICTVGQLNELGFRNVIVVSQVGHAVVREKVPEVATIITNFWTRVGHLASN